jgi:FkbM family methyltransferase
MAIVIPSRLLWTIVAYVFMVYLYLHIMMIQESLSIVQIKLDSLDSAKARLQSFDRSSSSSLSMNLKEKLKTLELKLHSYLGYESDPFYWTHTPAQCNNISHLQEYCPTDDCDIIPVCLDNFPYNDCIIYDFGIRKQPEFGVILSKPPFNCQVYAFDPSPITKEWYATNKELQDNKNYHMFDYGGGGADEEITLREYNWGQVSIYSYPSSVVRKPKNCTNGSCGYRRFPYQTIHKLPVRSVDSVMKELGHDRVDVLKVDVEGSEYRMLEGLIENGACKHVNQISLEWHHYGYDERYGAASVPILNLFTRLLTEKCGISQFWIHDPDGGWPSDAEEYFDMEIRIMYNLASFMRVKK